jgi:Putative MetA-pathway of phenol degradation
MTLASRLALTVCCVIALLPCVVAAQSAAPINTDRPSFTNAARVIGPQTVQIESGLELSRNTIDTGVGPVTESVSSAPNVLVRLGMTRSLEFRVEVAGWVRELSGRPRALPQSSASDVGLALEYQFARQDGLGLDLAVIAGSTLPTGGRVSSGAADPFARLAWQRDLSGAVNVGGTLNWSSPTTDSVRLPTLDASLVLGHSLGGAWSAFWEGVVRHEDVDEDAVVGLGNVGVLWRFSDNVQLDVWAGRGLTDRAPDWRFGLGAAYRFRR